MYQPATGRFISRDPIREEGGLNLCQAFAGNPVNRTDFPGLNAVSNQAPNLGNYHCGYEHMGRRDPDCQGRLRSERPHLEFIRGDLSELGAVPGLADRTFDRILFLQSFGYARDPVRTLQAARAMLADDGFILLTKAQPFRYAVEQAEQNGTSVGEESFFGSP